MISAKSIPFAKRLFSSLVAALCLASCSNFDEPALSFFKKYGDIASVQSVSFNKTAIRGGDGWLNVDSSGDLTIEYQIDNPGDVDLEASLSVSGVADLTTKGITLDVNSKTSITVTYPASYLSVADMDAGGAGDISPRLFLVRTSDNYAQSYDTQRIKCNAPPPSFTNALSQYSSGSITLPDGSTEVVNELLVVCFSLPSLPVDVQLFTIRDSRTGITRSFDVSGGAIVTGSEPNGWSIATTTPGPLDPTYAGGPTFTPSGTGYYIITDVQDLLTAPIFDLTLTLYDRGGLTSSITIPSRLRKLETPSCSITTSPVYNTFEQPYVDMTIYAPANASDATLHFAVADDEGNPVADTRGNVASCVGSATFRLYPNVNGSAKTYTITQAYATKYGWVDSDDGASGCGASGTVMVTGKQLEDPIPSVVGGSSVPQDTEFVFASPQGANLDVAYNTVPPTHINTKIGPSPVSVTIEAAADYEFAVRAYKDYYQNSTLKSYNYTVYLSKIYVASYGSSTATGTIDDPLDSITTAMGKFTTPGVVGTVYVLDDMLSIDGLISVSGTGIFNIVGCKGGTAGSAVSLKANGGGTVFELNGGTLALRAISINSQNNASSGAVSVLDGTFIVRDKVNITGNTAGVGGSACNVFLAAGKAITVDQSNLGGTKVGVTTATAPTSGHPVTIASGYATAGVTDAPKTHFVSDVSGRAVLLDSAAGDDVVLATGGGGIDIDDPVTVSFDKTASAGVYTFTAKATASDGTETDITDQITSWSLRLYTGGTYTGKSASSNSIDLFGISEGTYIMKVTAVYDGTTYSDEIEIPILPSAFSSDLDYLKLNDQLENIHVKAQNVAGGVKFTVARPTESCYNPSAGGGFGLVAVHRYSDNGSGTYEHTMRCEFNHSETASQVEFVYPLCDMGKRYVFKVDIEPINPTPNRVFQKNEWISIEVADGGGEESITYPAAATSVSVVMEDNKPKVTITNPITLTTSDPRIISQEMQVHYIAGTSWADYDNAYWMTNYSCDPRTLVHVDPYVEWGESTTFTAELAKLLKTVFFVQARFVFKLDGYDDIVWEAKAFDSAPCTVD